jgi:hypothetical protein
VARAWCPGEVAIYGWQATSRVAGHQAATRPTSLLCSVALGSGEPQCGPGLRTGSVRVWNDSERKGEPGRKGREAWPCSPGRPSQGAAAGTGL